MSYWNLPSYSKDRSSLASVRWWGTFTYVRILSMAGYTEILDTNHHEHKVCLVRKDEPFICSGCKELGFELRYACHTAGCNHQYHRSCTLQPLNTRVPAPFYKHDFFFFKSVSTAGARCEACAAEVSALLFLITNSSWQGLWLDILKSGLYIFIFARISNNINTYLKTKVILNKINAYLKKIKGVIHHKIKPVIIPPKHEKLFLSLEGCSLIVYMLLMLLK